MYAPLSISFAPKPKGVGSCCSHCAEHGGSCGGKKPGMAGLGHGVQEYVPNSWQEEFAAYSLGSPLFNPQPGRNLVGMGDITDPSSWGIGAWALIGGGALLFLMGAKHANKRRKSRKMMRRVMGH